MGKDRYNYGAGIIISKPKIAKLNPEETKAVCIKNFEDSDFLEWFIFVLP